MSYPAGSQMSEEPVPWYHCGTQFGGKDLTLNKLLKSVNSNFTLAVGSPKFGQLAQLTSDLLTWIQIPK